MQLMKKPREEYDIVVKRFCCPRMKSAWDSFIHINIRGKVVISYGNGCIREFLVNFCPFCGKKIVMIDE